VKQEKPIDMTLFTGDIKQIAEVHPEIVEMFETGDGGKITIDKGVFGKNASYKFYIDPGSTLKIDDAEQNQAISNMLQVFMKSPQLLQIVQQQGIEINLGELFKRWVITSGIQGWDKIVEELDEEELAERQMQEQMQQQVGQMQSPEVQKFAQQLMSQQPGNRVTQK
jgi:hypothetical protein